jgi:hypothetical protein
MYLFLPLKRPVSMHNLWALSLNLAIALRSSPLARPRCFSRQNWRLTTLYVLSLLWPSLPLAWGVLTKLVQ